MTTRQLLLMSHLRACIAEVGFVLGENSESHLDLREFADRLEWYLKNLVEEKHGADNRND